MYSAICTETILTNSSSEKVCSPSFEMYTVNTVSKLR